MGHLLVAHAASGQSRSAVAGLFQQCQARLFEFALQVLKPGGHLFYAVPIGFDEGLEHLYFADADDWIAMTVASGLTVKMSHIGCVYPETGYDVCVVAQA